MNIIYWRYFLPFLVLYLFACTRKCLGVSGDNSTTHAPIIEFLYWNVDPFFHLPRKRINIHGILHESLKKTQLYCNVKKPILNNSWCPNTHATPKKRKFVHHQKVCIGHSTFHEIVFNSSRLDLLQYRRPVYCDEPVLQIWAVIYGDKSQQWFDTKLGDLTTFQLTISKKIAVVMPRSSIKLFNKTVSGILNCSEPVIVLILFALIFGILLWFIEHQYNDDISKNFIVGSQTTIWCSFVTMTTVGYGDIYPKTFAGKIAIFFWVTIGLAMIAVMCGTVFNSVDNPPSIYGKRLAVIPDTMAERFAQDNLNAHIVRDTTNRKIFQSVIDGRADAALINADIYVNYQKIFRGDKKPVPLHVVQEFEVEQPILIAFNLKNSSAETKDLYDCMTRRNKHLIFQIPLMQQPLQNRVDVVYYVDFEDTYIYLIVSIVVLVVVCIFCHIVIKRLWSSACIKRRSGTELISDGFPMKNSNIII